MKPDEVRELGGGRVYTGRQAVGNGLVDELGGLDLAIDRACEEIGVEREDATILTVRQSSSFFEQFVSRTVASLGLHRFFGRGETHATDLTELRAVKGLLDR